MSYNKVIKTIIITAVQQYGKRLWFNDRWGKKQNTKHVMMWFLVTIWQ